MGDGVLDSEDNCPRAMNPDQADLDGDRIGDACDNDDDGDFARDIVDNRPRYPNPDQRDADGDGIGVACDPIDDTAARRRPPTATPSPRRRDRDRALDRQAPRVTLRSGAPTASPRSRTG